MTTYNDLMAQVNARREADRASGRAVAEASGVTVAEFDADTTAPDPRPETEQIAPVAIKDVTVTLRVTVEINDRSADKQDAIEAAKKLVAENYGASWGLVDVEFCTFDTYAVSFEE